MRTERLEVYLRWRTILCVLLLNADGTRGRRSWATHLSTGRADGPRRDQRRSIHVAFTRDAMP